MNSLANSSYKSDDRGIRPRLSQNKNMGNSNRFGWIKVRSGNTSYVGSVKHSHCVLYMHEQILQGVFVFDAGQGNAIMGDGKTSM